MSKQSFNQLRREGTNATIPHQNHPQGTPIKASAAELPFHEFDGFRGFSQNSGGLIEGWSRDR